MSVTLNTVVFTAESNPTPNSVRYAASTSSFLVPNYFDAKRVDPKPNGSFAGVARTSLNFHRKVLLNGVAGTYTPLTAQLLLSQPIGAAQADVLALLDDVAEAAVLQAIKDLVWQGKIQF